MATTLSIDMSAVDAACDREEFKSMSPVPIKKDKLDSDSEGKSSQVVFNSSLRVVLVPSRQEYREANCDLWWTGDDFSEFHASARSEVKNCSLNQSISHKEAKAILYQPGMAGEDDYEDDYMMGGSSRESSIDSERNMSSESDPGPGFSDWLSKQMPLLSPGADQPKPIEKVDSMVCLAAKKCKRKHKEKEDKAHKLSREESTDVDDSFGAMSSAPLFYEDLHLSVAVPQEVPLVNRERMSKKNNNKENEEEGAASLHLIIGFFTIPLLGYYLVTYCS